MSQSEEFKELKIAISDEPKCPHCQEDEFDDWWHDPSVKIGTALISLYGRLKCHSCGKFFAISQFSDKIHSTAWVKPKTLRNIKLKF